MSQNLIYLKQNVGKILSQAFAETIRQKPQFPVKFLAHWLKNFSKTQKLQQQFLFKQELKQKVMQSLQEQQIKLKNQHQQEQKKKIIQQEKDLKFKQMITNHQYHQQILQNEFPQFIQQKYSLTGVYIAQIAYQKKPIQQTEFDQNAHLQLQKQKIIQYIGYSNSHKQLMANSILPLDKGITSEAIQKAKAPVEQQNEQQIPPPFKYIYVENVIKEQRIFYFRLPKLGAFMAIPMITKSYISEQAFDTGIVKRKQFIIQKQEYQKQRQAKLQQLSNIVHQIEEKYMEGQEQSNQGNEKPQDNQQLEIAKQNLQEFIEQCKQLKQPEFEFTTKQIIVCLDTLGQDREIQLKHRQQIYQWVNFFKNAWESKQREVLSRDINSQIQYQSNFENITQIIDQMNQQQEKESQNKSEIIKQKEGISQKQVNFEMDCAKLEKIKQILNAQNKLKTYFFSLTSYRFIKFSRIFTSIFLLLGYDIKDIYIKNTAILDWKNIKHLINQEFIIKLFQYNFKGSKPEPVKPYQKINFIQKLLSSYKQQDVDHYNISLGRLFKYMNLMLRLRKVDVQIRKQRIEMTRKIIVDRTEMNQKIIEDRQKALQKKKSELTQQELQAFNQEQQIKNIEIQMPLLQIPQEVEDDIDLDVQQQNEND